MRKFMVKIKQVGLPVGTESDFGGGGMVYFNKDKDNQRGYLIDDVLANPDIFEEILPDPTNKDNKSTAWEEKEEHKLDVELQAILDEHFINVKKIVREFFANRNPAPINYDEEFEKWFNGKLPAGFQANVIRIYAKESFNHALTLKDNPERAKAIGELIDLLEDYIRRDAVMFRDKNFEQNFRNKITTLRQSNER